MSHSAPTAGLCAGCRHCRRVANARGAVFFLCARADTDPVYARYPRLPVLQCPGFEPADPPQEPAESNGKPQ